jgi:hypothetical protein
VYHREFFFSTEDTLNSSILFGPLKWAGDRLNHCFVAGSLFFVPLRQAAVSVIFHNSGL